MARKKHKQILIIAQEPFSIHAGGVERYIQEQEKFLKQRGHQVDIIFVHKPWLKLIIPQTVLNKLFLKRTIKKQLQREDYDLVLLHHPLVAFKYFRKFNLPAIYFFHASYYQELLFSLRLNISTRMLINKIYRIEKYVLNKADKIILLSNFSKKVLTKTYPSINKRKIVKIPGAVDLKKFKAKAKKKHKKIKIFTARRLTSRMGLENLIIAMAELVEKNKDIHLEIAGKGYLENELQRYIDHLQLAKNIKLLGYISEAQLIKKYQQADLFVLPTIAHEGFGLVTVEALACGTPVMATPVGASPEILAQVEPKLIFKNKNATSIAAGIQWFVRNKRKHKKIISTGKKLVRQKYSWDKVIRLVEKEF